MLHLRENLGQVEPGWNRWLWRKGGAGGFSIDLPRIVLYDDGSLPICGDSVKPERHPIRDEQVVIPPA
jgi:hypothetical protein